MIQVIFGKDRYHQQSEMQEWCEKNVGPGSWSYNRDIENPEDTWCINSMFGTTFFTFRHEQDATAFKLVWS